MSISALVENIKENAGLIEEKGSLLGSYGYSAIKKITFNDKPFLLTNEALVFGKDIHSIDKIVTISMITEKDCKGHFGSKFPLDKENLRIPLLHLSRIMIIAAQIVSGLVYPEMIPILVETKNVRANNQNLVPPPAIAVAKVIDFVFNKNSFSAKAFAKVNGEPYAEIGGFSFELMPKSNFKKTNCHTNSISKKLLEGYKIKKEMYYTEIEELILEREPFHRLDKAILAESSTGDMKLITISRIGQNDCEGQLLIDDKPTILPIDYARLMALTAELLASIVTKERFDNFPVIPIAVRVDRVDTSNSLFFSPPANIIIEATISAKNRYNPNIIKRGKKIFWADEVSTFVNNIKIAKMEKIVYALMPEDSFLKK